MTNTVHFTKMQGAGNDYIYVNTLLYTVGNPSATAREWSAPHTGIGSDGLVLIGKPTTPEADFSMRIFNADGSEATMCGNASRCIGKYVYERGLTQKTEVRLQTLSGIKVLRLKVKDGQVESVVVDMLTPADMHALTVEGRDGIYVSMGNPHFVVFVDDVEHFPVEEVGCKLEHHPAFPNRCNIEFAQVVSQEAADRPAVIRTRVWERGSGITLACGTGACATAVAACLTRRAGRRASIVMDGGQLDIDWRDADVSPDGTPKGSPDTSFYKKDHVYLSGPASFVFDGEANLIEN